AGAAAPAGEDCPPLARSHRRASRHSPRESFSPLDEPLSALLILFQDQQHNSKRITSQCQTSSLQVALSKTLRPPNSPPTPTSFHRSVSRSEEHTSELQSLTNLVCRLLLEKNKNT